MEGTQINLSIIILSMIFSSNEWKLFRLSDYENVIRKLNEVCHLTRRYK